MKKTSANPERVPLLKRSQKRTSLSPLAQLDFLPDEILCQIFFLLLQSYPMVGHKSGAFVFGRLLVQLQLVCKRWCSVISDSNILWKHAVKIDLKYWDLNFPKGTSVRSLYIQDVRNMLEERRRLRLAEEARLAREERKERVRHSLDVINQYLPKLRAITIFYGVALDWINLILFAVFTILLVVKLEKESIASYYLVFVPWWIMSFLSFVFLVLYEIGTILFSVEVMSMISYSQSVRNSLRTKQNSLSNYIIRTTRANLLSSPIFKWFLLLLTPSMEGFLLGFISSCFHHSQSLFHCI